MLYYFELQMIGAILLPTMLAVGILMWLKRRKDEEKFTDTENEDSFNI
ncbi:MAG: hypothetical protein ACQ9CV_06525 [Nitrosopumilus sp.]|jgi:hypothetical protein